MLLHPGEIVLIDIKTHRTTGIAKLTIKEAALCRMWRIPAYCSLISTALITLSHLSTSCFM
jgi:hypothetical protein